MIEAWISAAALAIALQSGGDAQQEDGMTPAPSIERSQGETPEADESAAETSDVPESESPEPGGSQAGSSGAPEGEAPGGEGRSARSEPDEEPASTDEPPAGPMLALGADGEHAPLIENAETYASYHADVDEAGRRELLSGDDLDATMDALAAYYGDDRLADAQIAYAALVAAQHPEFIDSVRSVVDYYGYDAAASGLLNDPAYVTGFRGADMATDSVVDALGEDVAEINDVAQRYRQAAYNLQTEAWAQRRARDRQERLSAIESASDRLEVRFRLSEAEAAPDRPLGSAAALFEGRADAGPDGPVVLPQLQLNVGEQQLQPDERRVGRILAVAALESIEAGDMSAMDALLSDPGVERCIAWARLDLAQCVAAGHFKYEDSFCIAEHALADVANCLTATRAIAGPETQAMSN
ncbi:hypothetical protein DDZ18_09910 [Marinicauda salina]|uniref:Uncharacterized protein n=1 Tax=Marinicauda salina TaxID=2135793 RepID=A0A2U2BSP0_9PROT|nr:hypothetical protein [Marinicauda salina]PWE17010.1 hypothetical protein DDZ18_09910 [Marinicauda salina]